MRWAGTRFIFNSLCFSTCGTELQRREPTPAKRENASTLRKRQEEMKALAALLLGLAPQPARSFLLTPRVASRAVFTLAPRLAPLASEKPPWMAAAPAGAAAEESVSTVGVPRSSLCVCVFALYSCVTSCNAFLYFGVCSIFGLILCVCVCSGPAVGALRASLHNRAAPPWSPKKTA